MKLLYVFVALFITAQAAVIRTGLEQAQADGWSLFKGHRVGILTNPTAIFSDSLDHAVDVMLKDSKATHQFDLVGVFGPEHGFRGDHQAGAGEQTYVDKRTGLTVFNAYGVRGTKLMNVVKNSTADMVVFDIQDVGVRYYTYIWSMWDMMCACQGLGLDFVVLDRPNPMGGLYVGGPVLHSQYSSGVGRLGISQSHGMTVGELANMFANEFPCTGEQGELMPRASTFKLHVIEMQGWKRSMLYEETGMPWVSPSPNIPSAEISRIYNGFGYMEGTNCSTGRGTTRPFAIVGAPFLLEFSQGKVAAQLMNEQNLPGVHFREAYFIPTFDTYTNVLCGGFEVTVTDPHTFDPIHSALVWLQVLHDYYPKQFAWQHGATTYWIDYLTGTDVVRTGIDAGKRVAELEQSWAVELNKFKDIRQRYLRYV